MAILVKVQNRLLQLKRMMGKLKEDIEKKIETLENYLIFKKQISSTIFPFELLETGSGSSFSFSYSESESLVILFSDELLLLTEIFFLFFSGLHSFDPEFFGLYIKVHFE